MEQNIGYYLSDAIPHKIIFESFNIMRTTREDLAHDMHRIYAPKKDAEDCILDL